MVEITLWAPQAKSAQAVIIDPLPQALSRRLEGPLDDDALADFERVDMTRDGENFRVDLPAGTNYLLSIDGQTPRPDPRSAAQPWGVHGPSQVFDTSAYSWQSEQASHDVLGDVIYELHIGTFTPGGTLDSAIERLGYLKELGVKTVELMPVAPFPGERGWGYDGVYWYGVQESYGGPAALQRFVDAAHSHGLAVCLDVVYNHFGPAGNYAPTFAPYFTDKHTTPWGDAINFDDEGREGVRAFVIDAALRWLHDFRIDALRLDAVHALIDDSPTHILAELSEAVDELEQQLGVRKTLIAESDMNQPSMVLPRGEGGLGIDGQWDDDVHHALHSYLTGETFGYYVDFGAPETLAKALEQVFVHDGCYSTFRETDWGAKVPEGLARDKFVISTQNHDQVGNRGQGDRPDERLPEGVQAASAAILLLSPYTPMIFQGQEWATKGRYQFFTDHDAELGKAVSEGRMEEFGAHGWEEIYGENPWVPDPQSTETFETSKLDWAEIEQGKHAKMFDWYRRLIKLRQEFQPKTTKCDWGEGWFRMRCEGLAVAINSGDKPVQIESDGEIVESWGQADLSDGKLTLQDKSVAIIRI